jgi:hypothetical protein
MRASLTTLAKAVSGVSDCLLPLCPEDRETVLDSVLTLLGGKVITVPNRPPPKEKKKKAQKNKQKPKAKTAAKESKSQPRPQGPVLELDQPAELAKDKVLKLKKQLKESKAQNAKPPANLYEDLRKAVVAYKAERARLGAAPDKDSLNPKEPLSGPPSGKGDSPMESASSSSDMVPG